MPKAGGRTSGIASPPRRGAATRKATAPAAPKRQSKAKEVSWQPTELIMMSFARRHAACWGHWGVLCCEPFGAECQRCRVLRPAGPGEGGAPRVGRALARKPSTRHCHAEVRHLIGYFDDIQPGYKILGRGSPDRFEEDEKDVREFVHEIDLI